MAWFTTQSRLSRWPGASRRTHIELLAIQVPKSLHKGLVLLWYCESGRENIGEAGSGMCAEMLVEVEKEIVEDGELMVDGGLAVANLLV